MTRAVTNRIHKAMDEGLLDPRDVADMALNWLSEFDVEEMMRQNDLLPYLGFRDEDDEEIFFDDEEEDDEEELFEEE